MNSISANLNVMIKASEKASKVLIRDFGELEKLQISSKSHKNFLTLSNLRVEKIIIEELTKAKPSYSILSEKKFFKNKNDKQNTWILKSIDGKMNFLHGVPHFAISIAHQHDKEIISGLIFDPIKNEMFYAEKNNGAFLNNQRIHVSNKNEIEDILFATEDVFLKKKNNISIRKMGSISLDMAYLATGRYDGFFQKNLNLFDVAAGNILIAEAGGIVYETKTKKIEIIAANVSLIDKLKKEI